MSPLQEHDALPDESEVVSDPDEADLRTQEFVGLLAGFPIALQHHLLGTRALPQPPLCDLLPADYLSSLKRTESRVRFAEEHSGPSGSGNPIAKSAKPNGDANTNGAAPGAATHSDEESDGKEEAGKEEAPAPVKKSNLHAPYPAHLPLSLLRLLEAYVAGFAQRPVEKGGWTPLQTERAIDAIKGLNAALTEAESIYNGELLMAELLTDNSAGSGRKPDAVRVSVRAQHPLLHRAVHATARVLDDVRSDCGRVPAGVQPRDDWPESLL